MTTSVGTPKTRADASRSSKPHGSVSVRSRMTLLLGATVSVVAIIFLIVQHSLDSQLRLLVRERVSETGRVLRRVLDLRASGASVHADDYTRWDDFAAFARKPDANWGQINLTESINTFGLDIAWVLDDHYRLIFTANPSGNQALAPLPVPPPMLAVALGESPIRHFYSLTSAGMLEVWTSSIQTSSDFERKTIPAGYYVIGRLWTPARLAELSALVDGTITLEESDAGVTGSTASSETGEIRIVMPFGNIHGSPVANLAYSTTFPVAPRVHSALSFSLIMLVGGALLLFVGVSLALTRWVARPLALITDSLREENPSLLYRSMARHDEFGHLARLVRDFFAQRGSLIEAREASEAAARAKQEFLANISHELRTPMHGIISYSRFGTEDAQAAPREELLEYFQQILHCGTTLLSLLDELLDLAKFDAGRMRLEFAQMAIGEVAEDVAGEFATLYPERQLELEFEVEPEIPPVVADRMKVLQVFRNLLSNAAKFTPAGGKVSVRVARTGQLVRVIVEDSGKGIPPDELELVFDRFSQASNTNAGSGGTGLGLPLCREIVQAHGGRIWAEGRSPNGTRMMFELPLAGPGAAGVIPAAAGIEPATSNTHRSEPDSRNAAA